MNQLRPSFDVFLPVLNIGEEQITGLEDTLARGVSLLPDPKTMRGVFRPAEPARAKIATAEELANFHEAIGLEGLDTAYIDEAGTYLRGSLRSLFSDEVISVPTLPPTVEYHGRGLILRVAESEEVIEGRAIMKDLLAKLYGIRKAPDGVWLDDKLATGVWLAQSDGPASNWLLREARRRLLTDDTVFDAYTDISGAVEVLPNPPRDSGEA